VSGDGPRRAGPDLRERLADWSYAAGWLFVRALPEPVAALGFRLAADVAYRRQGPRIRRLRQNLRRVLGPEASEEHLDRVTREGVRSYARYWMETFRLPSLPLDRVLAGVDATTEGVEHLDNAHAQGRGVIVVLPHMGNYEIAGAWLVRHGLPFTTVAERLRPDALFERFLAYRQKLGMEVLPLTGGDQPPADVLAERLRAGGTVCLLGDRDMTASGVEVDFFGERATMPAGPALLAIRTGASLLPVSLWHLPGGWGQRVHPPVAIPVDGPLRERIRVVTQRVADTFAAAIAEHPSDWHMMQRLWLSDARSTA
jgi:phosphatidylinositol dimannoside acyltransferase